MRPIGGRLPTQHIELVAVLLAVGTGLVRAPRHLTREALAQPLDALTILLAIGDVATVWLVDIASLLLLSIVLWLFIPQVYPSVFQPQRRGFRLIVIFLALWLVPTAMTPDGPVRPVPIDGVWAGVVWVLLAVCLFSAYHALAEQPLAPESQFLRPLAMLVDRSGGGTLSGYRRVRERLAERPILRPLNNVVVIAGGAAVYAIPAMFLGFVASIVTSVYPLFEVLTIVFIAGRVYARERAGPNRAATDRLGTVEEEIYASIQAAIDTGGLKGIVAVFTCLFGLLLATGMAIGAVQITTMIDAVPPTTRGGWLVLTSGLVSGAYCGWVWYRQLRRLPDFLTAWQLAVAEGSSLMTLFGGDADRSSPAIVTRPVDNGLIPPFVFAISTFIALFVVRLGASLPAIMVAGWVIFQFAIGAAVVATIQRDPQPALTDETAIPVGIAAQGLIVAVVFGGLFNPLGVAAFGIFLFVGFLPVAFWYPTIEATTASSASSGAVSIALLAAFGLIAGMLWRIVDSMSAFFLIVSAVCVGGAVILYGYRRVISASA